jgi:hypothetical protein
MMRILIDDALEGGPHRDVEAVVRNVAETLSGTEELLISVVRVQPGVWHVFVRDESPGQWSVLPSTSHEPLVEAMETALRKAGV